MFKLLILSLIFVVIYTEGYTLEASKEPQAKIVGGDKAPEGAYPYQVSLRRNDTKEFHACGGSIIRPTWILTAAHCTNDLNATDITAVVGTNKLSSGGDRYKVKQIINHEDFNRTTFANDIALLEVDEMSFNAKVAPIDLTDKNTPGYTKCILTGWGNIQSGTNNNRPDDLRMLTTYTIEVDTCQLRLEDFSTPVTDKQICTTSRGYSGACQGDSGGPLVLNKKLVGVVSWGVGCARGYPDVYARVFSYRDWILGIVDSA
ncbi:unnamed protein product [Colias eurytheme]|nr:unnamed protein product [Colias eurytheme]